MERETISMLLALQAGDLTDALSQDLAEAAFSVELVHEPVRLAARMAQGGASVAVVDVVVLDQPWFEHLASWRLQGITTPVIFVLAPDYDLQPSPELWLGRYDFLVKPVRAVELAARARSAKVVDVRPAADTLEHEDLVLHLISKAVLISGEPVELTAFEYRLLRYFMMRQQHVISQAELSAHLYAPVEEPGSNTIEAYVSRLRRKIGASRIRTIRGMGYRFG